MEKSEQAAQAPVDLQAELKKLTDAVGADQDQIAQVTKAIAGLQQDISVLQAGISDIDQTVKAYIQALQAAGDLGSLRSFIDQEASMAAAAVGAGKAALDKIIADYDHNIDPQSQDPNSLTQKAKAAQAASDQAAAAYAQAQKAAGDKQAAYDSAKAIVAKFQAWAADIKTLKGQVTAAADAGSFGAMYFLVGEMKSLSDKLSGSPKPDDLRTQLNNALADLQAAKKDLRDKKDAADAAAATLAAAQKALNDARTGRRAALLEKIKNWVPPTEAPKQPKSY
jgi:chromosome segregation ATPase